ncbi:MAG: TetR/AcrR family transcriptional regulator [Tardiphaga sp.]|jgi:AcrR family transcriptional regulator|nr:TetR/AcrR family transcriptional regulator [Tardiphaga sp.]
MKRPAHSLSKEERVIAGATDVFLRYGFARTTMGDIAERVGISRPALYLLFANKEEAFAAVIRRLNDDQLAAIRAALPGLPTLHAKVLFACETWGAHGVDLMTAHPDAKDLFDLSFAPVQEIYLKFQTLLAELLEGPAAGSALNAKPAQLARVVTFAMRGFRETASNGRDMRRLIALQVSMLLAALGVDDAGSA